MNNRYTAPESGTFQEPIPEDVYVAGLYSFIDIGTQTSNNPQYPDRRQVILSWEIPDIMQVWNEGEPERPASISSFFSFTMGTTKAGKKSNLLAMVDSWRGVALTREQAALFEFDKLLGKWCQLQVQHRTKPDGNIKAVVENVMKCNKSMFKAWTEGRVHLDHPDTLCNKSVIWMIDELDESSTSLADCLPAVPEWQQQMIVKSQEFQAIIRQQGQAGGMENHSADTDEEFF